MADKVVSLLRRPFGQQDPPDVQTKIDSNPDEAIFPSKARARWRNYFPDEVTLETEKTEPRWPKLKEKVLETMTAIKALPSEVKEQVTAKLTKAEPLVEVEPDPSDPEADIDGYEIVELKEFVFLLGGANGDFSNDPTTTVEVYNSVTGEWKPGSPLLIPVTACSVSVVKCIPALVVLGGYGDWKALNAVQMFDFVTKEWTVLPHSRKRRWGALAASTDHGIVLAGGCDSGKALQSVELYNFKRKEWYTLPSMREPRCNFGGALIRRRFYIAGGGAGFYFNSAKNSVEMFDGEKGEWCALPSMKYRRYGCAGLVWKHMFIVLGGCDDQGVDVLPVEALDMEENTWSELAPLPVGMSLCRAVLIQSKMVAFAADGSERTAYAFDFETNNWETFMEIPHGRNGFAVEVIGV